MHLALHKKIALISTFVTFHDNIFHVIKFHSLVFKYSQKKWQNRYLNIIQFFILVSDILINYQYIRWRSKKFYSIVIEKFWINKKKFDNTFDQSLKSWFFIFTDFAESSSRYSCCCPLVASRRIYKSFRMKYATSRECTACPGSGTRRLEHSQCCEEETVCSHFASSLTYGCRGMMQDSLLWWGMEVSLTQMRTGLADSQRAVFPERPSSTSIQCVQTEFLLIFFRLYCRICGTPISIFRAGKLIGYHSFLLTCKPRWSSRCISVIDKGICGWINALWSRQIKRLFCHHDNVIL